MTDDTLAHIPNWENIILGGWIEQQAVDGKIEIDRQRFEDVRTGIRLALEWMDSPAASVAKERKA